MKIRETISEVLRRRIKSEDYNYQLNFKRAISNNRSLNLSVPDFELDPNLKILSSDLLDVIHESIFVYPKELIAGQCFDISRVLSRALNETLGLKSLVTSGYLIMNIESKKSKVFYEPLYFLKKRVGKNNNIKFPIHCWLTLPNMCTIDATVLSTLISLHDTTGTDYRKSYIGSGALQKPSDYFCYQPVFLGTDFIDQLNLIPNPFFVDLI